MPTDVDIAIRILRPKLSYSLNLANDQRIPPISSWHNSNGFGISRTAQVTELESFDAMPGSVMIYQYDEPLNSDI